MKQPCYRACGWCCGDRFCEQPPAVVLLPHSKPVRAAVELVTPSGERDFSFSGYVEVGLHADGLSLETSRNKVQCTLGLCLWDHLVLLGPPGTYRLKASIVHQLDEEQSERSSGKDESTRPAYSAPILFRTAENIFFFESIHSRHTLDKAKPGSGETLR